jgi:enamine deaminase RidA (YjgF/YER057c/UK114 family)
MINLKNIVEAAGSNMRNILTTTIYLNENDDWSKNFKAVND